MLFQNRTDAGKQLAKKLKNYRGRADTIVLALPRGGVPVGYEVATELDLPLDVFMVRKLGVPGHEEYAFGSIASGGVQYINRLTVKSLRLPQSVVDEVVARELRELERREKIYREYMPPYDLQGKHVIIVDDGLATGATMQSAVRAIKLFHPKEIIVAVPVCAPETCAELKSNVDVWCVCSYAPEPFYAVGVWYQDFGQTTDEEVQDLLARSRTRAMQPA